MNRPRSLFIWLDLASLREARGDRREPGDTCNRDGAEVGGWPYYTSEGVCNSSDAPVNKLKGHRRCMVVSYA